MAESTEAHKHDSAGHDECGTLALSFPTLVIDPSASTFELITEHDTASMRPAPPSREPSDAASTLDESTYDLVSNPDLSGSGILSDDDARTESLASEYDHTQEGDFYEEEEDDEGEDAVVGALFPGVSGSMNEADTPEEELAVHVTPTIDDSGYTSHTARPEQSFTYLDFTVDRDRPSTDPNFLSLVHTIQDGSFVNCNSELQVYDAKYVSVEMLMSVARRPLRHVGAFRLLIVSPNLHFSQELVEHLNYALSCYETRDADKPFVLLSHCNNAYFAADRQTIMLDLDSPKQSTVSLRGGRVQSAEASHPAWDLAIFMHSSLASVSPLDVDQLENTFEKARLGLTACNVPIIDLSTHRPLYRAAPHSFYCDTKSFHLRVTTKQDQNSSEVARESLPIDIDQFLSIDPQTLNAHLSLLTQASNSIKSGPLHATEKILGKLAQMRDRFPEKTRNLGIDIDSASRLTRGVVSNLSIRDIIATLAFAMATILLCTQLMGGASPGNKAIAEPNLHEVVSAPTVPNDVWSGLISRLAGTSESASAASPATVSPGTAAAVVSMQHLKIANSPREHRVHAEKVQVREEKQRAREQRHQENLRRKHHAEQEKLRRAEAKLIADGWHHYSLERTDARTMILTAPAHIVGFLKAKPVLTVSRSGKPLGVRIKPLSDNTWAVDLPQTGDGGDAVLSFKGEYQLPTLGLYAFDYHLRIGHDKSPYEKVKDLVAQEFILVQTTAKEVSVRMTTGLQQYVGEFGQRTRKRVNDTKKALAELSGETSTWQLNREQRLNRLKRQKKALKQHGKDMAAEVQTIAAAARGAVDHQVDTVLKMARSIAKWQQDTKWPVRAADWTPSAATRRGLGNAQGVLRKFRIGSEVTDSSVKRKTGRGRQASPRNSREASI